MFSIWKKSKSLVLLKNKSTLSHIIPAFNDPERKVVENILRKGEIPGYKHLLLFLRCFSSYQ